MAIKMSAQRRLLCQRFLPVEAADRMTAVAAKQTDFLGCLDL
jgi:hypothetical protein